MRNVVSFKGRRIYLENKSMKNKNQHSNCSDISLFFYDTFALDDREMNDVEKIHNIERSSTNLSMKACLKLIKIFYLLTFPFFEVVEIISK